MSNDDTYVRHTAPMHYFTCGKCGGFYRNGPDGTFIKEAPFASACSCLERPTVMERRVTHVKTEVSIHRIDCDLDEDCTCSGDPND